MNYTEFVKVMQAEVKKKMAPEVSVEIYTAIKNNGRIRTGLVIMHRGINMSPTIYLEEFYKQYLNGAGVSELAHTICGFYEQVRLKQSFTVENVLSYQKIKDRIVYKLIQKKSNEQLLKEIPHEEYLDLAVVYYLLLDQAPFGMATLLIRREHMEMWGVTEQEIAEAAKRNTPRLLPVEIDKLTDYMYIVTNTANNLGAAVMVYPDIWKKVWKILKENFYILPSSIHEVILIPESCKMSKEYLGMIVHEINEKEVDEEEILSDTVYYYNREENKVTM